MNRVSPRRRVVSPDEVLELYERIKSSDTIGVFDAAEALRRDDVATALARLTDARHRYEKRHRRTLKSTQDAAPTSRVAARSEKVHEARALLVEFEEALERQVKIRRAVPKNAGDSAQNAPKVVTLSSELLLAFRDAPTSTARYKLIEDQFGLQPLVVECLQPHQTCLVQAKTGWHLLECIAAQGSDRYTFQDRGSQQPALLSAASLRRAAEQGKAYQLSPRRSASKRSQESSDEQVVLDESELIVLWSVVRDTGLLPNASEITQVKKNELQRRQYDRALQKMLLLQRSFLAASRAKRKAFARDLAYLESQKQNLPLREIERRKLQIARDTRLIERAEGHFTKVMNSLHALDSRRS